MNLAASIFCCIGLGIDEELNRAKQVHPAGSEQMSAQHGISPLTLERGVSVTFMSLRTRNRWLITFHPLVFLSTP